MVGTLVLRKQLSPEALIHLAIGLILPLLVIQFTVPFSCGFLCGKRLLIAGYSLSYIISIISPIALVLIIRILVLGNSGGNNEIPPPSILGII